jgi:exodeoxyribonuclease V alpha subunit
MSISSFQIRVPLYTHDTRRNILMTQPSHVHNVSSEGKTSISGTVVRVIFRGDDDEFGIYEVGKPGKKNAVVMGKLPALRLGERITTECVRTFHQKYGEQWKVVGKTEVNRPGRGDTESIKLFLSNNFAENIGKGFATVLVESIGPDILEILDKTSEEFGKRLEEHRAFIEKSVAVKTQPNGSSSSEEFEAAVIEKFAGTREGKSLLTPFLAVDGIGQKRAASLVHGWRKSELKRSAYLFLWKLGVPKSAVDALYRKYKNDAESCLMENPYRILIDVDDSCITFSVADTIARGCHIEDTDPRRIEAGLSWTIKRFVEQQEGCTTMSLSALAKIASEKVLRIPEEFILQWCHDKNKIRLQDFKNESGEYNSEIISLLERDKSADGELPGGFFILMEKEKNVYGCRLCTAVQESEIGEKVSRLAAFPAVCVPDLSNLATKSIGDNIRLDPSQQKAIQTSVHSSVSIVTGGPGTGKSTIMKVLCDLVESSGGNVKLLSPTGKAARRLAQTTKREATTAHLFLLRQKISPRATKVSPLTTFVVDEASMMDVELFCDLVKEIPLGARLVLVGDRDQLPSVGAGNVLGDMIACGHIPVSTLNHIHRQRDGGIVKNAHLINSLWTRKHQGEVPADGLVSLLSPGRSLDEDEFFILDEESLGGEQTFGDAALMTPQERSAAFESLAVKKLVDLVSQELPRKCGYDPLEDIQVLSSMKRGVLGTHNLNRMLRERLNPNHDKEPGLTVFHGTDFEWTWRIGDKAMNTKNNYKIGVPLINGMQGIVSKIDAAKKIVHVNYGHEHGEIVHVNGENLIPSYAVTVHKAQGSEYPCVVTCMSRSHAIMLRKRMLYTAVTRAKNKCFVVSERKVLDYALGNNRDHNRSTFLADHLSLGFKHNDPVYEVEKEHCDIHTVAFVR